MRTSAIRPRVWVPVLALGLLIVALAGRGCTAGAVAKGIRAKAAERGLSASWRALRLGFPLEVDLADLNLTSAEGDTVFHAESLNVEIKPWSVVTLRPRVRAVTLAHATAWMQATRSVDPDTLIPEARPGRAPRRDRSVALRSAARRLTDLLLAEARGLPHLVLHDVSIQAPPSEGALFGGAQLLWLELRPVRQGVRLTASGRLRLDQAIPFEVGLDYGNDDRLSGGVRFLVADARSGKVEPLRIGLDGRIAQDRRAGVLRLGDSTRVTIGRLPFLLSGSLDRRGPRLRFALAAAHITQQRVLESIPGAVLGPLRDLAVRGEFDYRLSLDLDLDHPDDVEFTADVIPHGLVLDRAGTRLRLFGLDQPFVATIHLPRGVIVTRPLSLANPHFRPLESIDSLLTHAVVTNEDGGFFRHRGFNTEAVKMAIAENLKAGAYRRGAGTITMQLARNLYLGHERTLSRKAQEVVLAWVLEHLTGVSKQRLLEIYLNIIEWGPGVHGADEAAEFYFGHDAGRLTIDEALFLSTVVPAPRKWRYRLEDDHTIRRFARAQMHFIGRAMIGKGWLSPDQLPPADDLRVEIRGPARDILMPPVPKPADENPVKGPI